MRGALDRVLSPVVDSMLRRFERTVSPDEHRRLASQRLDEPFCASSRSPVSSALLARLREAWASELGSTRVVADPADPAWDLTLAQALERASDEGAGPALPLHLLALASREPRAAREQGAWDSELGDSGSFPAVGEDGFARAGLVLLAGRRSGRIGGPALQRAAHSLAAGLEPKRWFARAGSCWGTANLLRALLGAAGEPSAYAADVCERLLRHVEVRRDQALEFRSGPGSATWQARLERLRFTHALLDASESFRDLRFLNAALKQNDRHHAELRRAGSGPGRDLLSLHYAASIARQESLVRSLCP